MSEAPRRAVVGRAVPGIAVAGTGIYAPAGLRRVGNDEVHAVVRSHGGRPMDDAWVDDAGVVERAWSAVPGERAAADAVTTDELLAGSAAAALDDAGIDAHQVDLLIAATTTTSRLTTSMAAMAGGHLGIRCAAFELRAGCASSTYGLAVAAAQLAVGAECVVVTSAETLSKAAPGAGPLPYLAADGAAAVVLVRSDDPARGLLASWSSGDGSAATLAGAPGALPPHLDDLEADRYRLVADRRFDAAAAPWWPVGPAAVLEAAGVAPGAVDAFVTNQAHRARFRGAAAAVGVDAGAVVDVIAETANCGAASQFIALDRARRDGRAGAGSTVLLSAVGGGLSAAAVLLRP